LYGLKLPKEISEYAYGNKKVTAQSKNKLTRYSLFPGYSYTKNFRQDYMCQNGFVKHGDNFGFPLCS